MAKGGYTPTGDSSKRRYITLAKVWLEHESWKTLKPRAKALMIDLYSQYNGFNNGDLSATYKIMRSKGWKSSDQIQKAIKELLNTGWVVKTRQGGLGIGTSLYAVTFHKIDGCKGKIECKPTDKPLGYWKQGYNPELNPPDRI